MMEELLCVVWIGGAQHCVGYLDQTGFDIKKTLDDLKKKIDNNKKGFELLKNTKYPKIIMNLKRK